MDPAQIPIRDLHLPTMIGWWPLAPGWWGVIAVVVIGLLLLIRGYLRKRARGAGRRHALRLLEQLVVDYKQHQNAVAFGTEVSELLRRTMLAYAPRGEVAGLTGDAWLEWLDRDMDEPLFEKGAGKGLIELPYRDPLSEIGDFDVDALKEVVRSRLLTPVGGRS